MEIGNQNYKVAGTRIVKIRIVKTYSSTRVLEAEEEEEEIYLPRTISISNKKKTQY